MYPGGGEEENLVDSYYDPKDLDRFSTVGDHSSELFESFMKWYSSVFADGALTQREKRLIALAVAHAVQCPYCIDSYTQGCLEEGCSMEQLTEAIHVAAAIRGGASLIHGVQACNVADRLRM